MDRGRQVFRLRQHSGGPQLIPVPQPVLTVTGQNADGETVTKGYSLAHLKELEETTPIGYQYKLKRFTYIVAAVEYVPMDKLLADAGIVYGTGDILTASDGTKTSALGYQQSLTLNNGVNADGSTTVPVALALRWGENRFGFSDAVDNANSSGGKDTLRFCYGIGTELTAEDRLLDKTTTLTVSVCTHADGVTEVPEVPATCTEDGYTGDEVCKTCQTVVKKGEIIPALGHDYKDGKCSRCGTQDPNQPVEPVQPDTPAAGDSSNMTALWIVLAVAGVGIIVLVVLLVTKRKNKKD